MTSRDEEFLIGVPEAPDLANLAQRLTKGDDPTLSGIQLVRAISGANGKPSYLVVRMSAARSAQFKQEHPELLVEPNAALPSPILPPTLPPI